MIRLIGDQSLQQGVTIYEDDGLKVYVMHWCWAFCRKLDRFNGRDKGDILALLPYLEHPALSIAQEGNAQGAADKLWAWIEESCAVQIASWQMHQVEEIIRERVLEVANAFVPEE